MASRFGILLGVVTMVAMSGASAADIKLTRLAVDEPPATVRIQWARDGSQSLDLAQISPSGGLEISRVSESQPRHSIVHFEDDPDWDLTTLTDTGRQFVRTDAASAVSALSWGVPGSSIKYRVNRSLPFSVLSDPRYLRRTPHAPWPISAVALLGSPRKAVGVVFPAAADGQYAPHVELPSAEPESQLLDLLIVRWEQGYYLLARYAIPGSPQLHLGTSDDGDPGGRLAVIALDEEFKGRSSAWLPFGNTPVYAFDADIDGRDLAIFATTAQSGLVSVGRPAGQGARTTAVDVDEQLPPISSPSVMVQRGTLHIVALSRAGSTQSQVLGARIPVADIGG